MSISTKLDAPTEPPQRSDLIDALRAVALFGVIMVNMAGITMVVMASKMMASIGPADIGVMLLEIVLVFGKARAAFAFLFGIGFGILLQRAERRGGDFRQLFMRRMLALFAFGVINQTFFFFGDILANYALLGLLLLLFRRMPDKLLVYLGFALIILPSLLVGMAEIMIGGTLPNLTSETIAAASAKTSALGYEAYSSGHYIDTMAFNASWPLHAIMNNPAHRIVYNLSVFGMFLLGSVVARHQVLMQVEHYRPMLKKAMLWFLPIGFVLNGVYAIGLFGMPLDGVLRGLVTAGFSGPPILALGYIAALALFFSRRAKRMQAVLAPAGRMALTNYLASGAIGSYCFYGYGFGLLGKLNIAGITLFATLLYLALLSFSHIWLSRFRVGPMEWIWRSLSYGQAQPILRIRQDRGSPSLT
jgi:uncharacterized protein